MKFLKCVDKNFWNVNTFLAYMLYKQFMPTECAPFIFAYTERIRGVPIMKYSDFCGTLVLTGSNMSLDPIDHFLARLLF